MTSVNLTVSRPWKPANGGEYGTVEIRMAADFQFDRNDRIGLVNAEGLTRRTVFDVLKVTGDPEWSPRFHDVNHNWQEDLWRTALGGNNGSYALAGIDARDSNLWIKRLEVRAVPGAGLFYVRCPKLRVDSAFFERCGGPVFGFHDASGKAQLSGLVSRDHWWSNRWGPQEQAPGVSTRRFADRDVCARGELALCEAGFQLLDYTAQGDGYGFKVSGTEWTVRGYQGGCAWIGGVVPDNLTTYPDPVRYRHLHEARGCLVDESVFSGGPFAALQTGRLITVSYPFTEPLLFRRDTFIKGRHAKILQLNLGANIRLEDPIFIGATDAQDAISLAPAFQQYPAATAELIRPRYYAS